MNRLGLLVTLSLQLVWTLPVWATAEPHTCMLLDDNASIMKVSYDIGGLPIHVFRYVPVVKKLIEEGKTPDTESLRNTQVIINGFNPIPIRERPEILAQILKSEPILKLLKEFPELASKEWDQSGLGSPSIGQKNWGDHTLSVTFSVRGKAPGEYSYFKLRIDPSSQEMDLQLTLPERGRPAFIQKIQGIRKITWTGSWTDSSHGYVTLGLGNLNLNNLGTSRLLHIVMDVIRAIESGQSMLN